MYVYAYGQIGVSFVLFAVCRFTTAENQMEYTQLNIENTELSVQVAIPVYMFQILGWCERGIRFSYLYSFCLSCCRCCCFIFVILHPENITYFECAECLTGDNGLCVSNVRFKLHGDTCVLRYSYILIRYHPANRTRSAPITTTATTKIKRQPKKRREREKKE